MTASPELMGAVERKARELGVWAKLGYWYGEDLPMVSYGAGDLLAVQLSEGPPRPVPAIRVALWLMCHQPGIDAPALIHTASGSVDELHILADSLMTPRSLTTRETDDINARHALGHVLALWLAGKLREEHVLGVERREVDGRNSEAEGELRSDSWWCEGGTMAMGPEDPCYTQWVRPVLEARPA